MHVRHGNYPLALILLASTVTALTALGPAPPEAGPQPVAASVLAKLPLAFIPNQGQV